MQLSIIIDANGNAAIATVDKLGKAVKTTGTATEGMGAKSRKATSDTQALATQSGATQAKVTSLSAAQKANAATAQAMGTANRVAAGNMGNLVAQFNDIGVMMAAGQNPLTLALQQGTQISQVIGPMGAAGAVKALGGAFIGMLNPISLVTIGTIAGGAALFQWATNAMSAEDAGGEYADVLERVKGQLSEYFSLIESHDDFGAAGFAVAREDIERTSQAYEDLIAIAKIEAFNSIGDLTGNMVSSLTNAGLLKDELTEIDNLLTGKENSSRWLVDIDQTNQFADALDKLSTAVTLDDQYSAALSLRDTFKSVVDVGGDMTDSQIEFWRNLSQSVFQMELLGAAAKANAVAMDGTNAALTRQYTLYGASRAESDASLGTAQAMLDELNEQATLQAIIATYGADSAEAIGFQALAARDAYEETKLTEGMSADMRDRIMEAYDAANGLSDLDIGAGIRGAAADAAELARRLAAIAQITPTMQDEDAAMAVSLTAPDRDQREQNRQAVANFDRLTAPKKSRPGSGKSETEKSRDAAANEAKREQEAIKNLIDGLEDELSILRELDPIQKEMLRNRETLAKASAAERTQIEALIGTRNAETAALERQQEQWDFAKDTAVGFFDDLRSGSGSVMGALDGVASKLEDIAFQALLLGEGPLAGLFGTSDGGGIVGTLLGGLFPSAAPASLPAKAGGGKIYGPGSGTSDDVLMWGSNGEFMMTAKATQKYQPLLEMMNNGQMPALAAGGKVGGGSSGGSMIMPSIAFSIDNRGSTPVKGSVTEESDGSGGRKMKLVLADEVGAALATPGGGARKHLQGAYGLRKRTANR